MMTRITSNKCICQFFKFIIVGGLSYLFQCGLLYTLTSLFNLWYMLSALIAYLISLFVDFFLQKYWTFQNHDKKYIYQQSILLISIRLFNLMIFLLLMYVLVERYKMWYMLVQALLLSTLGIGSFLFDKYITFKHYDKFTLANVRHLCLKIYSEIQKIINSQRQS